MAPPVPVERLGHELAFQRVGHHVIVYGKIIRIRAEGKMLYRPQSGKHGGPAEEKYQKTAVVSAEPAQIVHVHCVLSIVCFPRINQVFDDGIFGFFY